jgi:hypothetical protein
MSKKFFLILMIFIAALTGIILNYFQGQQDINVYNLGENKNTLSNEVYPSLSYAGINLTDSTVYDTEDNVCTAYRNFMNISIYPCTVQSVLGKNIVQYVNFTWTGNQPQNTSWVFVYEGDLQSGKMNALANVSYTYETSEPIQAWVSNYLVVDVSSYVSLGLPDSRCQLGSPYNNTQMFNVSFITNSTSKVYCFVNSTIVNSTAFRISGWIDTFHSVSHSEYGYRWVDVTPSIAYLGKGLLGDINNSYYQVENVTFNPSQVIATQWIYTPKGQAKSGKWHIVGYNKDLGVHDSIIGDQYIYIDPWWNSNWARKRLISNLTGSVVYINITYQSTMNTDFSDVRFLNDSENATLGYFLEKKQDSAWAIFRVKTDAATSIYMYYRNPSATTSNSNFTSVYSSMMTSGTLAGFFNFDDVNGTRVVKEQVDGISNASVYNYGSFTLGTNPAIFDQSLYSSKASTTGVINITGNASKGGINPLGNFTINFWLNVTIDNFGSDTPFPISKPSAWGFRFDDGILKFFSDNSGTIFSRTPSSTMLGRWIMVTGIRNDSGDYIFINGTMENVSTVRGNDNNNQNNVFILSADASSSQKTGGRIDDLMIWNAEVKSADIARIYSTTKPAYILGDEQTTGTITVTSIAPANGLISGSSSVTFEVNVTPVSINNTNITLQINGVSYVNFTYSYLNNSYNYNWTKTLAEGNYLWNVTVCGVKLVSSEGSCGDSATRAFSIDLTSPALTMTSPKGSVGFVQLPYNIIVNFTANDINLGTCYYNSTFNATRHYISCTTGIANATVTSVNNSLLGQTIFVYVNDTVANSVINSTSYYIIGIENSQTFNPQTQAGTNEYFTFNLSYNSSAATGISAFLFYNNTFYSGTSSGSGDNIMFNTSLAVPGVTNYLNKTFYWQISLSNSSGTNYYNSSFKNQTIAPFLIDNCSAYSVPILNFTLYDEDTRTIINGTIEVIVNLYGLDSSILISTYNKSFDYAPDLRGAVVCANELNSSYRMDYQSKYYNNSATEYATEYKYWQYILLNNVTNPIKVSLYDLLDARSTVFSVHLQTAEFLDLGGAIIDVKRKYIPSNDFVSVESPLTDSNGNTIFHLVAKDETYSYYIYKEGVLIGTFLNRIEKCQNEVTGECEIYLNLRQATANQTDYTQYGNVSLAFTFSSANRTLAMDFSTRDHVAHTVSWIVRRFDGYTNNTICTTSSYGTDGTLTCNIPVTYGNTTIIAEVSSEGIFIGRQLFSMETAASSLFGGVRVILAILMFTTLTLLFMAHPVMIIIGSMLGLTFASLFHLVDGGTIWGDVAIGIWFFIAGGIILYFMKNR